jgi:hypothetical protein
MNPNSFKDVEHARQVAEIEARMFRMSRSEKLAWFIVAALSYLVGSFGSCAHRRGDDLVRERQALADYKAQVADTLQNLEAKNNDAFQELERQVNQHFEGEAVP